LALSQWGHTSSKEKWGKKRTGNLLRAKTVYYIPTKWRHGRYFKATEANRRREPGTREKVSSRRINLEDNTYVQEINVSQLPV
jgi:hypothetical protein